MNRVTVWHVFGVMDIGGAELRTLDLAEAMDPLGAHFEYVTLSGRSGSLTETIETSGSCVRPCKLGPGFPRRFYRLLRRHRPDVVDSHVATFSGAVLALAKWAGVPVRIAHFRSDGDGHGHGWRRRLQRKVMLWAVDRYATDIVGVAPSALESGYSATWRTDPRARVIPNGMPSTSLASSVSPRERLALGPDAMLLMHVGRPNPIKNRQWAVRVLDDLCLSGVDAHLLFVGGEGEDAEELDAAVAGTGRSERVHHLGSSRAVRDLMSHADVLLLPSHQEGLPGVVLEALSVGTPVVSSPVPGSSYIGEQLPGVRVVEQFETATWSEAVRTQSDTWGQKREALAMGFRTGPFTMEASVSAHARIYFREGA